MTRIVVAALLAVCTGSSARAADRVIVYPIRTADHDADLSDTLSDIVAGQIAAASSHEVLTIEDIRNLVEHLALHAAVSYGLRFFDTESRTVAVSAADPYDGDATVVFTDIYALPPVEHSLAAYLGLLMYL